ncbi:C3HC zinc finger-like-domain-containing protein [Aspergillus aurantiobrunneus]
MSYALETKKRKFHRVLESLTKPSNTETSNQTASSATALEHAPSAKRARLSGRDDTILGSVRKDILNVARPASRASSLSSQSRPSFVPWDRERFLERLETFRRVDRWPPKPSAVNEVEWAKRGWICTDVARVTCVGGCGGSVVVKIPDELDELDGYDADKIQERMEVRAKLVQEYTGLTAQGHGESCPWRNKGCDAAIHRLPLTNPDTAISNLKTRYSHILKMADQLPSPDFLQVPEGFNAQDIISILPSGELQTSEACEETTETRQPGPEHSEEPKPPSPDQNGSPTNEAAFVLAFLGWDSVDGSANLAGCHACFRRLGLWMYKPKGTGDAPTHDPLDAAGEHMDYCPWINRRSQSGTGNLSEKTEGLRNGWELLAQALKVKHLRKTRLTPSASRAGSEAPSIDDSVIDEPDDDSKKAKDREWWAKLRRMRQMLNVKSPKRKPSAAQ